MMEDMSIHIQEAQQTIIKRNSKRPPGTHYNPTSERQRQKANLENSKREAISPGRRPQPLLLRPPGPAGCPKVAAGVPVAPSVSPGWRQGQLHPPHPHWVGVSWKAAFSCGWTCSLGFKPIPSPGAAWKEPSEGSDDPPPCHPPPCPPAAEAYALSGHRSLALPHPCHCLGKKPPRI